MHGEGAKIEIPDEAFTQLCSRLNLPIGQLSAFRKLLTSSLLEAWRGQRINRGRPRKAQIQAALSKIEQATSVDLEQILESPTPSVDAAATLLSVVVREDPQIWLRSASELERTIAFAGAHELAARHFDFKGRTPGTSGRPDFDLFIASLFHFVVAMGGEPGVASKKGGDPAAGPIPKALDILKQAKLLPPNFIPHTENSILDAVRRAASSR